MFIDWYLPGYKAGGPIRSCANLIAHLGDQVDFYILTADRDYQSNKPYAGIETEVWTSGDYGERVMYLPPGILTKELIDEIRGSVSFDMVYIHGLFSQNYSILPLRTVWKSVERLIIAPRGMLRESAISLKPIKKKLYLSVARRLGWFKNVIFHATDDQEKSDIERWIGKHKGIHLAPNLPMKGNSRFEDVDKESGQLRLIFAGRIAPEKNLEFALSVLSKVKGIKVNMSVYGEEYDSTYRARCEKRIDSLPDHVTVEFCGTVPPSELGKVIQEHHALFLPTRGENFGHIILESFMAGRPVVISDQTPWRGLDEAGVGVDLSLDCEADFVSVLERMGAMTEGAFEQQCMNALAKYKAFAEDPSLIAASKAIFLPSD